MPELAGAGSPKLATSVANFPSKFLYKHVSSARALVFIYGIVSSLGCGFAYSFCCPAIVIFFCGSFFSVVTFTAAVLMSFIGDYFFIAPALPLARPRPGRVPSSGCQQA